MTDNTANYSLNNIPLKFATVRSQELGSSVVLEAVTFKTVDSLKILCCKRWRRFISTKMSRSMYAKDSMLLANQKNNENKTQKCKLDV